jgi:hypothetical protein
MSDPIEKLTRLGEALEGAPMPLPASEIRARGDRIRRRNHAVIAGASAAVVAAVAVPVVAFTLASSDDKGPDITPQPPTVSDSVAPADLGETNLLTSDDAIYPNGGSDWRESSTIPGDGQSPFSPCTQSKLAGLGATSVFQREFEFVVTATGEVEPTLRFNEIIGEFRNNADARAAYDEVKGWYDDCLPAGADTYGAGTFDPVPIGVDGTGETQVSTYGPVTKRLDPDGYEVWFLETGLVVSGDRIAVLTQVTHGQDYDWPEGTPVEQMLPTAAERLVLGNGATLEPTPTDDGPWPTTIPDGFPLTNGWPAGDGSSEYRIEQPSIDNQAMIPAGELQACDRSPVDPGAIDRLTTRQSWPEDYYIRELQLFPTDQEAVTYLAHVRAVYEDCATEGSAPTTTTEVNDGSIGDESLVITRIGDEIYRTVMNVVRVGNAVVVDLASDEGLATDVQDLATETRDDLADVVGAMYELQGGGSSGTGPDLSDPAGVTAIPDGFPLGLALSEPPVEDSETTVDGPAADVEGVRPQTACGADLSMPEGIDAEHQLGYAISTIGGYDGRTIHAHPTVQDALDQMDLLRSQLQGCDRDNEGDGLSDRVWESFNSDTGYDSITFGWTYEATEFQGPAAGQVYTVVRVGNAILAVEWGSEGSAQSQVDSAPNQVELAQLIADEMCIFAVAGC